MNWDIYDFIAAGAFVLFILVAVATIRSLVTNPKGRALGIAGILVVVGLAWAQLAVGLI